MANLPPATQGPPNSPVPAVGVLEVVVPASPYNVLLDMNACGLTRTNQDQTFSTKVIMDDFESCKEYC